MNIVLVIWGAIIVCMCRCAKTPDSISSSLATENPQENSFYIHVVYDPYEATQCNNDNDKSTGIEIGIIGKMAYIEHCAITNAVYDVAWSDTFIHLGI